MTRIMISYSHDDKPITKQLAELLRESYDHVWYDERLTGGDEWWNEILQQIAACDHFIFLLSRESMESQYCIDELKEAKRLKKHIVPIKVRRSVELPQTLELSELQIIDMSEGITLISLSKTYAALIRKNHKESLFEYTQEHQIADIKVLKELNSYINSHNITILEHQTEIGRVDFDFYTESIIKYWMVRQTHPEKHLINSTVEAAFISFDAVTIDYIKQMSNSFSFDDNQKYIASHYLLAKKEQAAYKVREMMLPDHELAIEKAAELRKEYQNLVKTIKIAIPDYEFTDYTSK